MRRSGYNVENQNNVYVSTMMVIRPLLPAGDIVSQRWEPLMFPAVPQKFAHCLLISLTCLVKERDRGRTIF